MTLPTHSTVLKICWVKSSPQQIKTLPTLDWNISFLRFETEINGIASFPKKNVVIIYIQKKSKRMRAWNFQGYWKAYCGSSKKVIRGDQVKKECNFYLIKKQSYGISMGLGFCSSWNSQGLQYNFVEFPEMKLCFRQESQG